MGEKDSMSLCLCCCSYPDRPFHLRHLRHLGLLLLHRHGSCRC